MSDSKLRIKFGQHEFEAEGSPEFVQEQLNVFVQLTAPQKAAPAVTDAQKRVPDHRIHRIRGRIVSLLVPASSEDAALLILLGQKMLRRNEQVTGGEIMKGLRDSGIRVPRADLILKTHAANGLVSVAGFGRSRTYCLTELGAVRAQETAKSLLRLVD